MSDKELLLTVEDHFLMKGRGLVVVPLLEVPPDKRPFRPFSASATIRRPDGTKRCLLIKFAIEHFTLVGGGSKWNVVPMLPEGTKETVPFGSQIFVSEETTKRLNGEVPNDRL